MFISAIPLPDTDKAEQKPDTRSKGEKEWDDAFDANNPDLAYKFE